MKLVLKILALPVLFVVKVICILGNLLTNVVSYVIGLLLLVIGGSAIYCIVKALWQSLLNYQYVIESLVAVSYNHAQLVVFFILPSST